MSAWQEVIEEYQKEAVERERKRIIAIVQKFCHPHIVHDLNPYATNPTCDHKLIIAAIENGKLTE